MKNYKRRDEIIMAETVHKTTAELRALLQKGQTDEQKALAKEGRLCARDRMALIFDEGTFVEVGAYIGRKRTELDKETDDSFEPVITGYGAVNGTLVYAFSQDFSRLHGALGEMHAKKVVNIIAMASKANAPIIGVFDSAGAKILEGVDALAGYGSIMCALEEADIPKIAVVAGNCGGATAVITEMFDLVIGAKKTGKLYAALSGKTAESVSADPYIVNITCEDDTAAVTKARALIKYFAGTSDTDDDINRILDIEGILANVKYDIHDIIAHTFDIGSFTEIGADNAKSMVTGLATMNGAPVAVVANNPSYKDGFLCPGAAKKAIAVLELAYTANLPVITLVDGNGIGDSKNFEEKGFAKILAKLASEYAKRGSSYLILPTVTVTLGASYGTAYTVLGSKALTGGIALALDRAKISAMNPESAVAFLDEVKDEAKHKEIANEWAERYASPLEAAKSGHIDDIIDSAELRQRIGAALAMLL